MAYMPELSKSKSISTNNRIITMTETERKTFYMEVDTGDMTKEEIREYLTKEFDKKREKSE